jgi:hypothetical protein
MAVADNNNTCYFQVGKTIDLLSVDFIKCQMQRTAEAINAKATGNDR